MGFGLLNYVNDGYVFFILAIVMRILQGIGTSFNMTSIYSLVATEFPDSRERHYGYIEMSLGIGMFLGPFISGVLYQYIHYIGTFMLFAGFLLLGFILDIILLPQRLNESQKQATKLESEIEQKEKDDDSEVMKPLNYSDKSIIETEISKDE